jgi:hypothetical protein
LEGFAVTLIHRPAVYKAAFEIPGLPKMANGSHGGWQREYGERRKWHKWVGHCLMGNVPPRPLYKIRATFVRCSSVEPDDDGLIHGFKPVRDALVKWGVVVDDKRRNIEATYLWEHAPRGKGKIRVELEEVLEDHGVQRDASAPGA